MTKKVSSRDWEALSAYLDDQLSSKERARLEARLQHSPELRSGMDQLRATRAVLRNQPRMRTRRNFTLTPEMVGQRQSGRAYPTVRLAAVLVSILLVLVFVGDFMFSDDAGGVPQMSSAPQAEMLMEALPAEPEGEEIVETVVEDLMQALEEPPVVDESVRVEEIESSKALVPTLARPAGEGAYGETAAGPQAMPSLAGTTQPDADVLALPMIVDDAEGAEPSVGAAETAASVVTPTVFPSWLSQLTPTLTTIRVLEILITLLAVGMWVGVWILRRR
jgi:anti-sigma factor RsiW